MLVGRGKQGREMPNWAIKSKGLNPANTKRRRLKVLCTLVNFIYPVDVFHTNLLLVILIRLPQALRGIQKLLQILGSQRSTLVLGRFSHLETTGGRHLPARGDRLVKRQSEDGRYAAVVGLFLLGLGRGVGIDGHDELGIGLEVLDI